MEAGQNFKVTVQIEGRPDGGCRAWCDDVPGLVLSHSSEDKVLHDIQPALEVILTDMIGCPVRLERLVTLEQVKMELAAERAALGKAVDAIKPARRRSAAKRPAAPTRPDVWEFVAAACHA